MNKSFGFTDLGFGIDQKSALTQLAIKCALLTESNEDLKNKKKLGIDIDHKSTLKELTTKNDPLMDLNEDLKKKTEQITKRTGLEIIFNGKKNASFQSYTFLFFKCSNSTFMATTKSNFTPLTIYNEKAIWYVDNISTFFNTFKLSSFLSTFETIDLTTDQLIELCIKADYIKNGKQDITKLLEEYKIMCEKIREDEMIECIRRKLVIKYKKNNEQKDEKFILEECKEILNKIKDEFTVKNYIIEDSDGKEIIITNLFLRECVKRQRIDELINS